MDYTPNNVRHVDSTIEPVFWHEQAVTGETTRTFSKGSRSFQLREILDVNPVVYFRYFTNPGS